MLWLTVFCLVDSMTLKRLAQTSPDSHRIFIFFFETLKRRGNTVKEFSVLREFDTMLLVKIHFGGPRHVR